MNKFQKVFDHKMFLYDLAKITGGLPAIIGERMKRYYISGKRPKKFFKGKFILCSNHISYYDPLICLCAITSRRVTFLATSSLFKNKKGAWWLRHVNCIKVDKENVGINTFKEAIETLNRGHIVTIFPEGTVNSTDMPLPFKAGVIMAAILADADIIPMYICIRAKKTQRRRVIFGDRINYKDYIAGSQPTIDEINAITKLLNQKELELRDYYLKNIKPKYGPKENKKGVK